MGSSKTKAETKKDAIQLQRHLLEDPEYEQQGIIFREFVHLKIVEKSQVNDQHFYNEWRFFFYKENLLCYGYYWVNAENIPTNDQLPLEAIEFSKKMAKIMSKKTNFFVIDIGQLETGEWIVIECNDGQQSGLSNCDPHELYSNLKKCLTFVKE